MICCCCIKKTKRLKPAVHACFRRSVFLFADKKNIGTIEMQQTNRSVIDEKLFGLSTADFKMLIK